MILILETLTLYWNQVDLQCYIRFSCNSTVSYLYLSSFQIFSPIGYTVHLVEFPLYTLIRKYVFCAYCVYVNLKFLSYPCPPPVPLPKHKFFLSL